MGSGEKGRLVDWGVGIVEAGWLGLIHFHLVSEKEVASDDWGVNGSSWWRLVEGYRV